MLALVAPAVLATAVSPSEDLLPGARNEIGALPTVAVEPEPALEFLSLDPAAPLAPGDWREQFDGSGSIYPPSSRQPVIESLFLLAIVVAVAVGFIFSKRNRTTYPHFVARQPHPFAAQKPRRRGAKLSQA